MTSGSMIVDGFLLQYKDGAAIHVLEASLKAATKAHYDLGHSASPVEFELTFLKLWIASAEAQMAASTDPGAFGRVVDFKGALAVDVPSPKVNEPAPVSFSTEPPMAGFITTFPIPDSTININTAPHKEDTAKEAEAKMHATLTMLRAKK